MIAEQTWSPYQEAIFAAVEEGKESLIVEAVAGSGKTSTLTECARRLTEYDNACAIAFNKRIADELSRRMPAWVPALTLNALGYRAWKAFIGKPVGVDGQKVTTLIRQMTDDQNPDYKKAVRRLVDLAKMAGIVPEYVEAANTPLREDTPEEWGALIEEYGIDFAWGREERGVELARRVLARSVQMGTEVVDFNDQMYLPVIFGADFPKYDVLFIDEAQDVSEIQRVMIERAVTERGRIVAFGDGSQALYHFRGAGANSLPDLKAHFRARSMPLSICYRCAKAIIKLAKEYVPEIEAYADAPEGKVEELAAWTPEIFQMTDAVLCRNNAPLVALAFRLLRAGKPCKVIGRDIGAGLIALVNRLRASSIADLETKLRAYVANETKVLGDHQDQIEALNDRAATLRVFMENARSPLEVTTKIEALFAEDTKGYLTLSSVHKAKGMEWPRVFILDFHLIGQRAKQSWERQAEKNVAYVAITRAQKELFFIRG